MRRTKKNKKITFLIPLIIIIGLAVYLCLLPSFKLSASSVKIEAGEKFNAQKYIKSVRNIDKDDIVISGKVNTTKPDDYEVCYKYKKKIKTISVTVIDTVSPKITPVEGFSIYAGESLTPQMLVNVDDKTECELKLDSRGQDLSKIGNYSVSVSATDLGKNTSTCKVKVTVKDPDITPPTIYGAKNTSITKGTTFDSKQGVTVKDDFDSNPTLTVDDSKLNINVIEKYIITYTATDASGNKSSINRTVSVVNPIKASATVSSSNSQFDRTGVANQPYLVAVNRAMCTVTVYAKDESGNYTKPIKAMACSVGKAGCETPTGRFNTSTRYEWRLMVDGSYGRYAIRINGSIMFHSVCYYTKNEANLEYNEYNKLGSPASLGCVRLCLSDIKWLYDNCPNGFPTVIYDDSSSAGPLGKPSSIKIDVNDTAKRGYDPTDWSKNSPWNK